MNKVIGYLVSAVGLAGLAVFSIPTLKTSVLAKLPFAIPASITPQYLTIGSVVVLAVGLFLVVGEGRSSSGRVKQVSEEVPIYEGEGKHRRIVGYKKTK